MQIQTPTNQIRQTNIAIVRIKKKGKKFEIACYKNKVISWRNGNEDDLDEVLQIRRVFNNVSKGDMARANDLEKCFGTSDQDEVCKAILEKGEIQVSPKERELMYEQTFKDIVNVVVEKCLNPDTQKPYPSGIVERALKQINYNVKLNKNAKQQALEAIRKLKKVIPIERAQMRLKLVLKSTSARKLLKDLTSSDENEITVEEDSIKEKQSTIVMLADPGLFRTIDDYVTKNGGVTEVLDSYVQHSGVTSIDESSKDKNDASDDEEEEEESNNVEKENKSKKKKGKKGKKSKKNNESDKEEEELGNTQPKSKKNKKGKKSKKKHESDESDEELGDVQPKGKKNKKGKKKNNLDESEEDEQPGDIQPRSKKNKKNKKSNRKDDSDESEEELEADQPKSKKNRKGKKENDSEESEEELEDIQPKNKKNKKGKKSKKNKDEEDESEEEIVKKKHKKEHKKEKNESDEEKLSRKDKRLKKKQKKKMHQAHQHEESD